MVLNAQRVPQRCYAHPFDRPFRMGSDNQTHGVGRDSDAIDGYTGIGWYEGFRDHQTGELFCVHCSDGVNGGKDAHTDKNLGWMEQCRVSIIERTKREAQSGVNPIHISSNEWAVMLNFTFAMWLDALEGQQYVTVGDACRHLDSGQIGTINSVPVIVDPNMKCQLDSPPTN